MSLKVLFNGALLVHPGGATKIDASAMTNPGLGGVGVVGLVGEAPGGEPGVAAVFSDPDVAVSYFRSGDLANAATWAFNPANDPRIPGGAQQVVCVKTNNSTPSTLTLQSAGVGSGTASASHAGPYYIVPDQALKIGIDSEAPVTAAFVGTRGYKTGVSASYASPSGKTLLVKIDGGEEQTYLATAGATAAAATVIEINNQLNGCHAEVSTTEVKIVSDTYGTGSSVEITGGTGTAVFGQSVAAGVAGTGSAVNLAATTAAEAAVVIQAAVGTTAAVTGDPLTITSATTGTGSHVILSNPTPAIVADDFGFAYASHDGSALVDALKFTSLDYGAHTNKLSGRVYDSGTGKIVTFTFEDGLRKTVETSPALGANAELTVAYAGVSATALLTVSATQLTITLSGGSGGTHVQTDGSADLVAPFATYATLQELVNYINQQTGYTAVAITTNPFTFLGANLDYVTSASCKTTALALYAKLYRIVSWVGTNSSLVSAERVTNGPAAPSSMAASRTFTGGTLGTSTAQSWIDAFDVLKALRVNAVVPCASEDIGSATIAAIIPLAELHAADMSSTSGKSERQAYAGIKGTKAAALALAGALNSPHICLCAQQPTLIDCTGNLLVAQEWAMAVLAAGMRAGAELGEPLTYKYIRAYGLTQNAGWNPKDDGDDMLPGGMLIAESVPNKGYRFVKGLTTYTREDNDAYTEESVVMGWKNVSYELRTYLEDLFTGRRMSINNLTGLRSEADAKLSALRDSGQIVDSILADGSTLRAYRNLKVSATRDTVYISATVSPVEGINYELTTLFLVPAQINL